jgi:hypothetical protein
VRNSSCLPTPFDRVSEERKTNCIYLGLASRSLRKRFLGNELRGHGHGTFFRSIGAVLGYTPEPGSLVARKNKRNYKFTGSDTSAIIDWLNENTIVNWIEYEDNGIHDVETQLIGIAKPLFNLSKNPRALSELKLLRAKCVAIANMAP